MHDRHVKITADKFIAATEQKLSALHFIPLIGNVEFAGVRLFFGVDNVVGIFQQAAAERQIIGVGGNGRRRKGPDDDFAVADFFGYFIARQYQYLSPFLKFAGGSRPNIRPRTKKRRLHSTKKKFDLKNLDFKDERDEINPVQTDTTDSRYLFDNDDAVVINFKRNEKK